MRRMASLLGSMRTCIGWKSSGLLSLLNKSTKSWWPRVRAKTIQRVSSKAKSYLLSVSKLSELERIFFQEDSVPHHTNVDRATVKSRCALGDRRMRVATSMRTVTMVFTVEWRKIGHLTHLAQSKRPSMKSAMRTSNAKTTSSAGTPAKPSERLIQLRFVSKSTARMSAKHLVGSHPNNLYQKTSTEMVCTVPQVLLILSASLRVGVQTSKKWSSMDDF